MEINTTLISQEHLWEVSTSLPDGITVYAVGGADTEMSLEWSSRGCRQPMRDCIETMVEEAHPGLLEELLGELQKLSR